MGERARSMAESDAPDRRYAGERGRIEDLAGNEAVSQDTVDRILEVVTALDPNRPATVFPSGENGQKTLAIRTLEGYAMRLRLAAPEFDGELLEQTNDSINDLMAGLASGTADVGPEDGYARGVVGQYQSALKAFYRYQDGHEVDPEAIPVMATEKSNIDDRDMLTVDEVEAMREAIDHPRERALFELLAYTGQRIRVIQTLQVKDVDVSEGKGIFYINDEAAGRKGAEGKRPLLGAREYVRQWLQYHPTGEPEDALITAIPDQGGNGTPGEPLSQNSIRYQLQKIAEKADVDKKVYPHVFRHYFTTIAKREYGMDDAHIKRLRGDAPGSNVMETTYQHLSDEDAIKQAEEKAGIRDPEESATAMTPETGPTCGIVLDQGAKACRRCGAVFTPDAQSAKRQIEEDMKDSYRETESGDEEALDKLDMVDELLNDPEVKALLLEKLTE
jgi:integrase